MNAETIIVATIWLAVLALLVYCFGAWLLGRISPKYAAKRKLRQKAKAERSMESYRKRKASSEDRLRAWAKEHSDDPVAKALLVDNASSNASTHYAETGLDLAATLRQRQQEADDLKSRIEARGASEAVLSQQLLEWSMRNPTTPEGRRHLVETLMELNDKIREAEYDIRFANLASNEEGSLEAIASGTRISDAEARKAAALRTIGEIQAILQGLPETEQL